MPAAVRPIAPARPARRTLTLSSMVGLLVVGVVVLGGPTASHAASPCPSAPAAVYHVVRPADGVSLYTTNQQEATAASAYGFTENRGIAFHAAPTVQGTMVAAHRLHHPVSGDFVWSRQRRRAQRRRQPVRLRRPGPLLRCRARSTTPVSSRSAGTFEARSTASPSPPADEQALAAAGWTNEGVQFFAAPAASTAHSTAAPTTASAELDRDRCPSARRTIPRRPTPCTRHRAATTPTPARRRRPCAPWRVRSRWRPAAGRSCCVPVAIASR